MLVGQLEHALRQRRREQHRLPLFRPRQAPQDEADIGDEAQIEHAVGLIQHQHLHVAQVEHVLLEVIDDAARGADQHIDAFGDGLALLVVVGAAEHHRELQAGVLAEHRRVLVDLHRQLARRRDHQRADRGGVPARRRRLGQQRLEQRHQEGGGLAGAGLRLAGHVPALQRHRQRLRLDRRAVGEAGIDDALHHASPPAAGIERSGN